MEALDRALRLPRQRRVVVGALGGAAVALALLVGLMALLVRQETPAFRGTALDPPKETLPFALRDQEGRTARWEDYRGRVVALTFLYTSCVDLCPLVAAKMERAHALLGDAAPEVAFLAITVDPERDTPEAIRAFSEKWGMLGKWDFLVGRAEELQPLWNAYWVGKVRQEALGEGPVSAEEGYLVEHTSPVHLIDRQGWDRVVYGSDFLAEDLAHDARLLLRTP